jgi:hypothetical protein
MTALLAVRFGKIFEDFDTGKCHGRAPFGNLIDDRTPQRQAS